MNSSSIPEESTLYIASSIDTSIIRHTWKLEWEKAFFEQQNSIRKCSLENADDTLANNDTYRKKEWTLNQESVIGHNEMLLRKGDVEGALFQNAPEDIKQVNPQKLYNCMKKVISSIMNIELTSSRYILSKSSSGIGSCSETILPSKANTKRESTQNVLIRNSDDGIQLWIWEKSFKGHKLNEVIELLKSRFMNDKRPLIKLTVNGHVAWTKQASEVEKCLATKIDIYNNTIDTKY